MNKFCTLFAGFLQITEIAISQEIFTKELKFILTDFH